MKIDFMSFLKKNKYFITCCVLLGALIFVNVYEPTRIIPSPDFQSITTSERTYSLSTYPHISNELIGIYNYFRDILYSQDVNSFDNIEPHIGSSKNAIPKSNGILE